MNKEQLSELHSILKRSEEHALTCTIERGYSPGIIRLQIEKGFLTISVSSKMVKQAINVFELFLRRMYKEGFSLILNCDVYFHCPASAIIVDGEMIPVRIKEKRVAGDHGILILEIYGGTSKRVTKVLEGTKNHQWEASFEKVIPYLHSAANRIRKDRLKWEAWRQRMEEKERLRKEHEKMITDRASVVKSIINEVMLYERAETIRQYCNIVEQRMCKEDNEERITTARQIADWIDPTVDYIDELLSERYKVEDFLK